MTLAKSIESSGVNTNPVVPSTDLIVHGAHVGGDNAQAETVCQKQETALADVSIRQDRNVRRAFPCADWTREFI
jgi:hypothetical protein